MAQPKRRRLRGRTNVPQCGRCHRFKSRPSSVCGHCGDDPVSYLGDRWAYDRAHGFDTLTGEPAR